MWSQALSEVALQTNAFTELGSTYFSPGKRVNANLDFKLIVNTTIRDRLHDAYQTQYEL